MMNQIYSSWKMLKHLDRVDAFFDGVGFPVCLQVDLTNRCNFKCDHCSQLLNEDYLTNPSIDLDIDAFKRALLEDEDGILKAVQITGGGEPTIHPRFAEITRFIIDRFEMGMVTNGSMLHKDEILNSLIGSKWIRISVDASTKEMYEKVHGCNCGNAFDNLGMIVKRFKTFSPDTILGFSFVISDLNYREITHAAMLARILGFDNIRFSGDIALEGTRIDPKFLGSIYHDLTEAKKEENESFRVFLMKERTTNAFFEDRPPNCFYAMLIGVITATGEMYHCCQRKNLSGSRMGSIYERSMTDIYRSQDLIYVKDCVPCWMDAKNHLLEYFYTEDPLHANFP
jgi:MoaA/NifB/PqqE/SkfB family radical SAM enzyme